MGSHTARKPTPPPFTGKNTHAGNCGRQALTDGCLRLHTLQDGDDVGWRDGTRAVAVHDRVGEARVTDDLTKGAREMGNQTTARFTTWHTKTSAVAVVHKVRQPIQHNGENTMTKQDHLPNYYR